MSTKFNRFARIAMFVLLVIAIMLPLAACGGGDGNKVEKAVSGAVSDGLDSQFQPAGACPANCDCSGIVQVCQ